MLNPQISEPIGVHPSNSLRDTIVRNSSLNAR